MVNFDIFVYRALYVSMVVDAMLMFSITPLAGLAFKDAEYPRLLNVSYSTVFKSSGTVDGGTSSSKKKTMTVSNSAPPDADFELKTLM